MLVIVCCHVGSQTRIITPFVPGAYCFQLVARGAWLLEREGHHTVGGAYHHTVPGAYHFQLVARGAWLLEGEGHHTVGGAYHHVPGAYHFQLVAAFQPAES